MSVSFEPPPSVPPLSPDPPLPEPFAVAPVIIYLNTFNDSNALPLKSNIAWLSTALPP